MGPPFLFWILQTHLAYCSPVRVLRLNEEFRCPHCADCWTVNKLFSYWKTLMWTTFVLLILFNLPYVAILSAAKLSDFFHPLIHQREMTAGHYSGCIKGRLLCYRGNSYYHKSDKCKFPILVIHLYHFSQISGLHARTRITINLIN
jgi:hypothetical protein